MVANFLWAAGTQGLITSTGVPLMQSEMASVANSSWCVSSSGGLSGVFGSSLTGQAVWGYLQLSYGSSATGSTATGPAAGANWAGWWLTSPDGGTTFESTAQVPPRPPDFLIPLSTGTIAASAKPFQASGLVRLPPMPFKVLMQNNTGNTMGTSPDPKLNLLPVAMQY
jgi:hypothetical protein